MPASTVDHVDVLIIGAGPAGLMAASWMAHMGVKARIVDKRGTKIFNGQADGVAVRTLEIMDSFDFVEKIIKEGHQTAAINTWSADESGNQQRSNRKLFGSWKASRYANMVTLHQGRIERVLIDKMKQVSDLRVERGIMPIKLDYDASLADDDEAYPITVQLRHLSSDEATPQQNLTSVPDGLFRSNLAPDDTDDLIRQSSGLEGSVETVKAKYMLGADGAHSWVRRQLGFQLEGDSTDYVWGVIDILAKTDFPDVRQVNTLHSNEGTVLWIPRERGITRLYVQLSEVNPEADGRADRTKINPDVIIAAAKKICAPYTIDYEYCDWWTAYQVGQRVGKNFSKDRRMFIAGDACHTHSPKMGQGMNVSTQDTFNLGWKLGLVAKGIASRDILGTYQSERHYVAERLITLDRMISRAMSAKMEGTGDVAKSTVDKMLKALDDVEGFQTGTAVTYGRSVLVASDDDGTTTHSDGNVSSTLTPSSKQHLATGIPLGQRMPSHRVLGQWDLTPRHFADHLKSDGRFNIVLFAGAVVRGEQMERVRAFCDTLSAPSSFLRRFNPKTDVADPVIRILTVHSSKISDVEVTDFPALLKPWHRQRGYDYNTLLADDACIWEPYTDAYAAWGVDRMRGCVVVLRPDQHVGFIGEMEDTAELDAYFSAFLRPAELQKEPLAFEERAKVLGGSSARTGNHAS